VKIPDYKWSAHWIHTRTLSQLERAYVQAEKSTLIYRSGIRRNVKKASMWGCRAESVLKEIDARKKDKG